MKLTKSQLKELIKEAMDESFDNSPLSYSPPSHSYNKPIPPKKGKTTQIKKCPSDWDGCQKQHFLCNTKPGPLKGYYVGNSKTNKDSGGFQMGSADYYWSKPCPDFLPKSESYIRQIIREEYETMMGSDIEGFSDEDELGATEPMRDTGMRSPRQTLIDALGLRARLDQMSPEDLEALAAGDEKVKALIDHIQGDPMLEPRM